MPKGFFEDPLIRALQHSTPWLVATILLVLVGAWIRFQLVEPVAWAQHCTSTPWDSWCTMRSVVITLIHEQHIGRLAALFGLLTFFIHQRWIAGIALLSGACAVLFYATAPGAFAILSGLLLLTNAGDKADHATAIINNAKISA